MKKKEKTNFTKATLSGISLIMLVVTIIIMLILATVIVVTISSNNPVSEANKARYESDVDNMQALFTNMVSILNYIKIIYQNFTFFNTQQKNHAKLLSHDFLYFRLYNLGWGG